MEFKPFVAIAASFLTGLLVSSGIIDKTSTSDVTNLLNVFFGSVITLITVGAALHRYVVKHPTAADAQLAAPEDTGADLANTPEPEAPVVDPALAPAA